MKVCFVSIVGRPNVGKSTLLNNLIEFETAITSTVAQTTRDQILGVYNDQTHQIIFTDTPGIHKPQNKLGEALNKQAISSLKDVDLVLFLSPINEKISVGDMYIIDLLKHAKNKIALITKTDIFYEPKTYIQKEEKLRELGFNQVLSFNYNDKNKEYLIDKIKEFSYESNLFYDQETITDRPMRFFASEAIRKYINEYLFEELPHSVAVEIILFEEFEDKYNIEAVIYVKKDSQKGIVIGKNASMIKKISTSARLYLQNIFNHKINLRVNVKVNKNWVNDEKQLRKLGY